MIWDCAVAFIFLTLIVTGWNSGFWNSWRAPVAVLLATLITQFVYMNACAWLVDQSGLTPQAGVFLGYAFIWLAIDLSIELFLYIALPTKRTLPWIKVDKGLGAFVAFGKAVCLVAFATLTAAMAPDMASNAKENSWVDAVSNAYENSYLVHGMAALASELPKNVKYSVISQGGPTYKPETPVEATPDERTESFKRAIKNFRDCTSGGTGL